jgi:preprotein translocase subunit SecF
MADETPAGRLRTLKRTMMTYAAFMIVLVIVTAVSGNLQLALLVALFGTIAGVALYDAGRLRIEVDQWRRAYGRLPPGDDD